MGQVQMGVPSQYPLALNTPLDRAYLRPLQEPLYDTEEFSVGTPPTQNTYFQRPISNATALNSANFSPKTEAETNINQSSMLDYPKEFSILGFNVQLDSTAGFKASAAIYRRAWFQFTFSGRRPYLQVPLHRMPQGVGLEGVTDTNNSGSGRMGMAHVANYYKFNLGRAALKIKPGEAFNVKLNWPVAVAATAVNPNYIGQTEPYSYGMAVMIVGLAWQPL
jgi:hypothetical protein